MKHVSDTILLLVTIGSPRTYEFISTAVQLQFDNETPMVVGNSIFAEFSVSRSVETLDCRLAGLPRQNCKDIYWHICEEN